MKNFKYLLVIFLIASCTKTGASYRPVVDTNSPRFDQDLNECQKLAKQYVDFGYDSAVKGGGAAAIGAGVGQMFGGNTASTLIGAGVGLGTAGVKKILGHNDDRKDIIKNCLRGRGYTVLK
jgi:outer membrane lipoprotein SlyB